MSEEVLDNIELLPSTESQIDIPIPELYEN